MKTIKKWNIEKVRVAFEQFKKEHGQYPTAVDLDSAGSSMPNSRYLQRYMGGVVAVRKALDLQVLNYTQGDPRRKIARMANARANEGTNEVYRFLISRFGAVRVHREFLVDYHNSQKRADFYVFTGEDGKDPILVDCFHPKDYKNLFGCINLKLKKYRTVKDPTMLANTIIYLNMNNELEPAVCVEMAKRRKIPLKENEVLMNMDQFKRFIEKRS